MTDRQDEQKQSAEERLGACQDQLLSLLVMDLGYDARPLYGHDPMRHQFAWSLAMEGRTDNEEIKREIRRRVESESRGDGDYHTIVQTTARLARLLSAPQLCQCCRKDRAECEWNHITERTMSFGSLV